jgi:signal transduction histidine kinase
MPAELLVQANKGAFPAAQVGLPGMLATIVGLSIVVTLYVRAVRVQAQRAINLAARRTAELRALNDILVADIEARKKLADSLGQSRNELRQLAEHNARVKEDERKRIAREIHDDLGQSMLALRIELSLMDTGAQTERNRERIRHALEQIDHTVGAMRTIINELRPAVLDLGLQAAIEWEVVKFRRHSGITTVLDVKTALPCLHDNTATALYRIVQESMTNIMRHARAGHVTVTLWCENGWVFLTLSDDGIGMSNQCRRKAKSFGLIGIAERIYALGGAFDTESSEGKGTTLTIAVPHAPLVELDSECDTEQAAKPEQAAARCDRDGSDWPTDDDRREK